MTMTGQTIYMLDYARPMAKRLASRKHVGPYMWTVPQPGPFAGRGYYAADNDGTPGDSTFSLRSCEAPRRINGWYCDDYQTMRAVVLRLPRQRGYLIGWTMGRGMASSIEPEIYTDETEAWRAADSHTQYAAAREREYREAQAADEE